MANRTRKNPDHKRRTDWRRIFVTVLAVVMVLALTLPLLATVFSGAHGVTPDELQSQIDALKGDAQTSANTQKELEAQLAAIAGDKAKAMEQLALLSSQMDNLNGQIANTQAQIDTYNALIEQQEVLLDEARAREQAAYERFCQRARSMEEAGTVSYWSVLFAARDFSDLLDRLALVDEIMSYDNKVVDDLAAARAEAEDLLAQLNATKAGLDEQMAQREAEKQALDEKVAQAEAVMAEIKGKEEYAAALLEKEKEEEERIRREIAEKEKEWEDLIASLAVNGSGYVYPLPYNNIIVTSKFGPRYHPLTGVYHNHSGTDIAAPGGTPIKAVQAGVVTVSAYAEYSYGEYVVINHGNGMSTLYAHMTRGSRKVKVGDVVEAGQVIGLVGATGSATGNHLHLELQINGERQSALDLFPDIKFDIRE